MTAQFIQIGLHIINLQLITDVAHIPSEGDNKPYTWIHFDHNNASILLEGEEAIIFWRALQRSSVNLTPQSPQLPALNHAQQSI